MTAGSVSRNEVVIDGRLLKLGALRRTPAGVPAIDLLISHNSMQTEAGSRRQVRCELDAVALGEAAVSAARLRRNQPLRVNGFLARRSMNNRQLVLHVIASEAIDDVEARPDHESRRT